MKVFLKIAHFVNKTGAYTNEDYIQSLIFTPLDEIENLCKEQKSLVTKVNASSQNRVSWIDISIEYSLYSGQLLYFCEKLYLNMTDIQEYGGRFGMTCINQQMLQDANSCKEFADTILFRFAKDISVPAVPQKINNNAKNIDSLHSKATDIRNAFAKNRLEYNQNTFAFFGR